MYSAETVSKYIIMRCNELGKTISNLKLQKILYFVQAEFLVTKNQPCFHEAIEAWDFGPVVPTIYHKYKIYGSASIPCVSKNAHLMFTEQDRDLIDGIIESCAKYSASTLVEITHKQAPWRDVYRPYKKAIISNESIKKFFKETWYKCHRK